MRLRILVRHRSWRDTQGLHNVAPVAMAYDCLNFSDAQDLGRHSVLWLDEKQY